MTNFSYNTTVPAETNNPSVDQPQMLINTASGSSIWDVDHVGFNATDGGTHKMVSLSSQNTPGTQAANQAAIYTKTGTHAAGSQLYLQNELNLVPLSIIRAYGFLNANGSVRQGQILNNTAVRTAAGTYAITLTANAVSVSNAGYVVIVSVDAGAYSAAAPLSATSQTLTATLFNIYVFNTITGALTDPTGISYTVLMI